MRAGRQLDAPGVRELPRLAALRRGRRCGKQPLGRTVARDGVLPERLFLGRREQHRDFRGQVAVERVLPEALHEGLDGEDVRRFPGAQAFGLPSPVEFRPQELRQAPVGGDDRESRRMPGCKPRKKLGFFEAREIAMHVPNHIGRVARRMSYVGESWRFLRL